MIMIVYYHCTDDNALLLYTNLPSLHPHTDYQRVSYLHRSWSETPLLASVFILKAWSFLLRMHITKLSSPNAKKWWNKYNSLVCSKSRKQSIRESGI